MGIAWCVQTNKKKLRAQTLKCSYRQHSTFWLDWGSFSPAWEPGLGIQIQSQWLSTWPAFICLFFLSGQASQAFSEISLSEPWPRTSQIWSISISEVLSLIPDFSYLKLLLYALLQSQTLCVDISFINHRPQPLDLNPEIAGGQGKGPLCAIGSTLNRGLGSILFWPLSTWGISCYHVSFKKSKLEHFLIWP